MASTSQETEEEPEQAGCNYIDDEKAERKAKEIAAGMVQGIIEDISI